MAMPSVQTVSGDGGGALQSHRVRPVKMRRSRRFGEMHEAYQPAIEDGRGIFPEDFRVKAPKGFNDAVRELLHSVST